MTKSATDVPEDLTKTPLKFPRTLLEAASYFSDPDTALAFTARMRWGDKGPTCPRCFSNKHTFLKSRRHWQCRDCRKQYSIKAGTIFEDSPLGLDKWLTAVWLLVNAKNGISSHELARSIGVKQTTAWYMMHRIRLLMDTGTMEKAKLRGLVEADETYVGGKLSNMHKAKRETMPKGRGTVGKVIVMGILERGTEETHSNVRTKIVEDIKTATLQDEIRANVEQGSSVYTDSLASYQGLDGDYVHGWTDHNKLYAEGENHTNSIENYWSLLKRTIRGTYTHMSPEHLFRYLAEQQFRFNTRKKTDGERFLSVVKKVEGKRLKYRELIEKDDDKQ